MKTQSSGPLYGPPTCPPDHYDEPRDLTGLLVQAKEHPPRKKLRKPVPAAILDASVYELALTLATLKAAWSANICRLYVASALLEVPLKSFTGTIYITWFEALPGSLSVSTKESAQTQVRELCKLLRTSWLLPADLDRHLAAVVTDGPSLKRHYEHVERYAAFVEMFGLGDGETSDQEDDGTQGEADGGVVEHRERIVDKDDGAEGGAATDDGGTVEQDEAHETGPDDHGHHAGDEARETEPANAEQVAVTHGGDVEHVEALDEQDPPYSGFGDLWSARDGEPDPGGGRYDGSAR